MRTVTQRAACAAVSIGGQECASIGRGLVVLAGFETGDTPDDVAWMARKILALRIMDDTDGRMNLSVGQAGGEVLIVSQFTLHALTARGNRPSFIRAARPEQALPLYRLFVSLVEQGLGRRVQTGRFGADMQLRLTNDGPVTILMDSRRRE